MSGAVTLYCLNCQYDLRNLSGHRCPECGRGFDPENRDSYTDKPRRRRLPSRLAIVGILWPLIVFGLCLLTRFAAWISLGRAPIPYLDDLASINALVTTLYAITEIALCTTPVAYFLSTALLAFSLWQRHPFPYVRAAILFFVFVVCWGGGFYLMQHDVNFRWFIR